jgi:hypothetical protein
MTEHGIVFPVRAGWRRSAHISRGSNDPPGGAGSPLTGRRGTGDPIGSNCEVREMRNAKTELHILAKKGVTGEPRDTEIGHAWFGGGRLEKCL